jgi:hypothetical protein
MTTRQEIRRTLADARTRLQCVQRLFVLVRGTVDEPSVADKRAFMYLVNSHTRNDVLRASFRTFVSGGRGQSRRHLQRSELDVPVAGTTLRIYLHALMQRVYHETAATLLTAGCAPVGDVAAVATMETVRGLLYAVPPATSLAGAGDVRRSVAALDLCVGRHMPLLVYEQLLRYMGDDGALDPSALDAPVENTTLRSYLIDLADEIADAAQNALQTVLLDAERAHTALDE